LTEEKIKREKKETKRGGRKKRGINVERWQG